MKSKSIAVHLNQDDKHGERAVERVLRALAEVLTEAPQDLQEFTVVVTIEWDDHED